jgi:hypothetical protein
MRRQKFVSSSGGDSSMTFFETPAAMFQLGSIASGISLLALGAISAFFASKLPSVVPDFWESSSGRSRSAPKIVAVIAVPLLALLIMSVAAYLTQPDVVSTLTKAQTGFWMRLGMSVIAPVMHGVTLAGHSTAKAERN